MTLEINRQAKPEFITEVPEYMKNYVIYRKLVGSKFICTPAPKDSDEDWLFWVANVHWDDCLNHLTKDGWEILGDDAYGFGGNFVSLRKHGNLANLILTKKDTFYRAFVKAANLCKKFNMLDKQDRIYVHDAFISLVK